MKTIGKFFYYWTVFLGSFVNFVIFMVVTGMNEQHELLKMYAAGPMVTGFIVFATRLEFEGDPKVGKEPLLFMIFSYWTIIVGSIANTVILFYNLEVDLMNRDNLLLIGASFLISLIISTRFMRVEWKVEGEVENA